MVLELERKRQKCETLKRKLIGHDSSVQSREEEAKEDPLLCGLGNLVSGASS